MRFLCLISDAIQTALIGGVKGLVGAFKHVNLVLVG